MGAILISEDVSINRSLKILSRLSIKQNSPKLIYIKQLLQTNIKLLCMQGCSFIFLHPEVGKQFHSEQWFITFCSTLLRLSKFAITFWNLEGASSHTRHSEWLHSSFKDQMTLENRFAHLCGVYSRRTDRNLRGTQWFNIHQTWKPTLQGIWKVIYNMSL